MKKRIICLLCALTMLFTTAYAQGMSENTRKSDTVTLDDKSSIKYNLEDVNTVSGISVTYSENDKNGITGFDVLMSLDDVNYQKVAYVENKRPLENGTKTINHEFSPKFKAQYVRVLFYASNGKKANIQNIEIEKELCDTPKNLTKTAKYMYLTDQPFITGDDIMLSDIDEKALTDGDKEKFISTTSEYASIVFELDDIYQVGEINVSSMVDGINIVDGYEVLYSLNGKKYHPYGYFANENANEDSNATNIKSCGLVGKNARYVKIILHTRDIGSISEIEIFGYPLTEEYDSVPVNITMKTFLLGYIDWSSYIGEAKSFGLYIEKFNFDNIEGLKPKAVYDSLSPEYKNRYCEYQPFEPETTYYIAITTTDKNGVEEKAVKPLKITTQGVVGDAPKDVFALNYYTSEFGAADQVHGSYQTEHEDNMIKLIDELNFNKNRWWRHYETELSRFAKIGMSYAVQSATGTDYVKSDNALGTWTYGQGNESDLHGTDTNAYLNELKQTYNIAKNLDKRNVVEAPALGGTEPASVKWLENLYKTDGVDGKKVNQYFDYLDFHAYCKIMDEQVEGLPTCVPEQIYKKLDDLRAVMTKYGDGDKPLVATELGWSTFEGRHYLIPVDYETQRDYLTRLYLIFISEGVREGYLYNFQNSGIDPKNFEHNIGIVDWFGVPKPAYYGLYTLSKVMQNVTFVRSLDEIKNPYYGMTFWDNAKGQYMTSLWSADNQTKTATLFVPGNDENVMILGTDGSYTSKKVVNNKVNVTISGAPIFVYSDEAATVEEMTVPFAVDNIKLDALRGETATFNIKRGKTGAGLSGELSAEMPKDFALEGELSFNETTENIPITISVPSGAEEIEQSLVVNIRLSDGSTLPINLTINVTKSMEISCVPEYSNDDNAWNMAVYIKNMVNVPLNATVSIDALKNVDILNVEKQEVKDLQYNDVKKVVFPLSKVPNSDEATISVIVENNGFSAKAQRNFNFSGVINDGKAPSIDGVLSDGEWDMNSFVTQNDTAKTPYLPEWKGDADCSFKIYRKWDSENFYLAAEVLDNVHYQGGVGGDLWQGDGIQFAIDPGRKNGKGSSLYHEIGIALNNDKKVIAHRWVAPLLIKQGTLINYKCSIKRLDTKTVYELSIPWSDLVDGSAPKSGDSLGFSLLVNDNDGLGRRGWLDFMGGIGSGKNTSLFEDMVLINK